MTGNEFAKLCLWVANDLTTSYMLGTFGNTATTTNISRSVARTDVSNKKYEQAALSIKDKGFMFDCVGLIKGILWGFNGDLSKLYGGAGYAVNGVPDIGADTIIKKTENSKDFSNIEAGEVVWMSGHVGVYVGDGKVVECTPRWTITPGVKVTMLENLGYKGGYSRVWTSHGHLPWVDYSKKIVEDTETEKRYQSIDELPSYAQEAISYFVDKKILNGTGAGLDLSIDMVRLLCILYRTVKGD